MAPRVPTVHEDDTLLTAPECARKVGRMHPRNWSAYAGRWDSLVAGARVVRVKPGGRGRMRWLRSAVVFHIKVELLQQRGEAKAAASLASAGKGANAWSA